jgi:hypothetical protein
MDEEGRTRGGGLGRYAGEARITGAARDVVGVLRAAQDAAGAAGSTRGVVGVAGAAQGRKPGGTTGAT